MLVEAANAHLRLPDDAARIRQKLPVQMRISMLFPAPFGPTTPTCSPMFSARAAFPKQDVVAKRVAQSVISSKLMIITIPYFLCRSAKPIAALLVAAKAQIV